MVKLKDNNVNMEGRWLKLTPKKLNIKSDLHGTILSHAASLKNAYDTKEVVADSKHIKTFTTIVA